MAMSQIVRGTLTFKRSDLDLGTAFLLQGRLSILIQWFGKASTQTSSYL